MLEKLSELEQATEDVWHRAVEESAMRELGTQSVAPSWATPSPPWEKPQEEQLVDWPHKFEPGPGWTKVLAAGGNAQGLAPHKTLVEYNKLDKELGKDLVKNVLGNYLAEQNEAVEILIQQNPGITGSEPMRVDLQEARGCPQCCRSSHGHSARLPTRNLPPGYH